MPKGFIEFTWNKEKCYIKASAIIGVYSGRNHTELYVASVADDSILCVDESVPIVLNKIREATSD